jgi:hypothetical protein
VAFAFGASYGKGHVPGVAFAFGASYGTNTFRYFQDHRNAAMEKNFTCFSRGSSFPTVFSSDRTLAIRGRSHTRDHWLYLPSDTHFNLDSDGSEQLNHFYQVSCLAPLGSAPGQGR